MRALSSAGLERFLDTEEVAGSNPVEPTKKQALKLVFLYKTGLIHLIESAHNYFKTNRL